MSTILLHQTANIVMGRCVIFGWNSHSDRGHVSFSRISVIRYHYGEQEYQLSLKRRTAWLGAILRDDIDESNMENYMICMRHFHSGKPAKPMDKTNIDWVPTLYLGHKNISSLQFRCRYRGLIKS